MKRLFLGIVIGAMIGMKVSCAFAQDLDHPKDKFEDFQAKVKAATKGTEPAPAGAAPGGAPPAAPGGDAASPLGPAGDLPLGGGAPGAPGAAGAAPQTPEELQAMMEQEAADQQKKLEQATFDMALKQLLPLSPEQIRTTLDKFRESREAAETPLTVPEPRTEVQTASLDPTAEPLAVRMAPGNVTTLTFLDATGAPWPIQDLSWAGPFTMQPSEQGANLVRISPTTAHGVGNISVRLVDMVTPIVMRLTTGIDWVHYRLDVRIPKPGPLAKTPIIEYGGLKTVAGKDDQMVSVLDGTPPQGAEKLKVDGVDGRTTAYQMSGRVYLRTPLTLLSPGWDASVSSADGVNVYAFNTAPVVLLSDEGRMVKAHIQADEVTTP
jgi:intracellular multiplication protein IcmK